jgi:RNA polymerase sigma factor (TIGR02999 family)
MRRILVDGARTRRRLKRGGGNRPGELAEEPGVRDTDPAEILAVHEALDRLAERAPRKAEIVKLRYFAGLSIDETAEALGISPRTVDYEWRYARAWLHRELSAGEPETE